MNAITPPTRPIDARFLAINLGRIASQASIEFIPDTTLPSRISTNMASALRGRNVFIAALPERSFEDVLLCAKTLKESGATPIPHFPARRFKDLDAVEKTLKNLHALGIDHLLLIAGDDDKPAGEIVSIFPILESSLLHTYGIKRLFFAGHPQGNKKLPDEIIQTALSKKQAWADKNPEIECAIVTQLCFNQKSLLDWMNTIRQANITLPVYAGIHGPTNAWQLAKTSYKVGIKLSIKVAFKAAKALATSFIKNPQRITPDVMLHAIVDARQFAGVHIFRFGPVNATMAYLNKIAQENHLKGRTEAPAIHL